MGLALLGAFLATLTIIALFAGIYSVVEGSDDITGRLAAYAVAEAERERDPADKRSGGLAPLLSRLDRLVRSQSRGRRLALQLAQANIRTTVPEFIVAEASAAVVGGAIGLLVGRLAISIFAGAIIGLGIPYIYLQRKRSQRISTFHEQLTDVLSLIVGSLRGGHALPTALNLVSSELGPPASEEFSRVLREIGYGLSQTEALNNLVKRMENDDLQLVVTAVNISHEVGGNLSLVLEKIADTIRERIQLKGEIRVLTTQQRLTSYLLVALPFFLGTGLALINPQWMMRMFAPGWIRIVPVVAVGAEVIGFVITQKITQIEV